MRSNFHKYFSILTGVFLLILGACNHDFQGRTPPKAVKGILDLTNWNFKSDGAVDLSGEYEFYWKQHLAPSDFTGTTPLQKTGFIQLPKFWNGYEIKGKTLHNSLARKRGTPFAKIFKHGYRIYPFSEWSKSKFSWDRWKRS